MFMQFEIVVRNSTPMIIGWYDPLKIDPQGLRATEIKGLWRWWSRAFIGGALYDEGFLHGISQGNILLKPTNEEAECISRLVGKIMGLGFAGSEKDAEASRFILYTEPIEKLIEKNKCEDELQRIKLLSLPIKKHKQEMQIECIKSGYTFKITVSKRYEKYRDAEELALKVLVVALQLMGLGKGSKRGLGSLDIEDIDISYFSVATNRLKELISKIYEDCRNIVKKYYVQCCKPSVAKVKESDIQTPPPLPVISRKSIDNLNVAQIIIARNTSFKNVHNFFIRSERCKTLYQKVNQKVKCDDDLRKSHNAWILGLPRKQKQTGYEMKGFSRRASPIMLSYHKDKNIFGEGVFISIFLSGDWPKHLTWYGLRGKQQIYIDFNRLYNAYHIAIDEFMRYLKAINAKIEHVWP